MLEKDKTTGKLGRLSEWRLNSMSLFNQVNSGVPGRDVSRKIGVDLFKQKFRKRQEYEKIQKNGEYNNSFGITLMNQYLGITRKI